MKKIRMKKLIAALLFFACMIMTFGSVYADVLDESPYRYYAQGTNDEGNSLFIDKNAIHHNEGNITTYIGVLRLSNRSKLFKQARQLVTPSQIPIYVLSNIAIDCANSRIRTTKIVILGVDISAAEKEGVKILWSDLSGDSGWSAIPNGIEPGAEALLCGASF